MNATACTVTTASRHLRRAKASPINSYGTEVGLVRNALDNNLAVLALQGNLVTESVCLPLLLGRGSGGLLFFRLIGLWWLGLRRLLLCVVCQQAQALCTLHLTYSLLL